MSNKYCSDKCDIFISSENLPEMMKVLISEINKNEFSGNCEVDLSSLKGICDFFDWQISRDADGNVDHIMADSELSWGFSRREKFVNVISPFVKDGSFVEMHGEDGDVFRIVFNGGKTRLTRPTISW